MSNELARELARIKAMQDELKQRLDEEQLSLSTLAQRLWAQQESEKARISRELHDGVGQLLTGLARRLSSLDQDDPTIKDCTELADMALADVRQLSRLMSPTILHDLGLKPAINWLCRSLLTGTEITYDCEIALAHPVQSDISILIYRISQEALVNIVKHSKATNVTLSLYSALNVVRLDIVDNGIGFDINETEKGVGLNSMSDRAKAYLSKFEITSKPGEGTRLSLAIPQ